MMYRSYFSHFAEKWCSHGGLPWDRGQQLEITNPVQTFAFRNHLSQMFVAANFRDKDFTVLLAARSKV